MIPTRGVLQLLGMELTISPHSSTPYDPWDDFERQRKYDSSIEEEFEIEEDVDDVDYDEMEDEDEE